MLCILEAMSVSIPQDILQCVNNINSIPDIIVEVIIEHNDVPVPYELGRSFKPTTPDRLVSPDCVPGIISLVTFNGIIVGQALILYAIDKYMVVNSNISFCEDSEPWYQVQRHFITRGLEHAEYSSSIPIVPFTLHYNQRVDRIYDQHGLYDANAAGLFLHRVRP